MANIPLKFGDIDLALCADAEDRSGESAWCLPEKDAEVAAEVASDHDEAPAGTVNPWAALRTDQSVSANRSRGRTSQPIAAEDGPVSQSQQRTSQPITAEDGPVSQSRQRTDQSAGLRGE
jgi:hypothetical protein